LRNGDFMVRKEYWDKSIDIIEFCNEQELKILSMQASKELNKRIDRYIGKFDADESYSAKVDKRKAKDAAIKKNMRV